MAPVSGPDALDPGDPAFSGLEESVAPDALDSSRTAGLLVRGGMLRLASYGVGVLLSVASMAALTRHLGQARFAEYTTIMSLATLVATITDSGMANIGTREYATLRGAERERLLRNLLGLRVVLSLLGVGIVVVFAVANGYDRELLLGGIAASLATVALVVQHTYTIPLTAELRLGSLSALELGRQAALVAGILALAALGAGVGLLLAVSLLANALLIAPTWRLARGRISLRPSLSWREWPDLLRATVVFSLATAVGVLYVYAAQILTNYVMDPSQRGLFAFSFRVIVVCAGVPGLVVSAALPVLSRAARDDRDRLAYVMQRIFEATLVGGVGAALVLCAGAPVVAAISGFAGAAPVLRIQVWALVASFVVANWSYGLLSLHLHRGVLLANLASLVVSIGLTIVLGRIDGARGAALATVGGETTLALASLIALAAGRPQYRPRLGVVPKVLLAGGAAAAAAFLVPGLPSLARATLAAAVYGAIVLLTRALPPEFRELLPGRRAA